MLNKNKMTKKLEFRDYSLKDIEQKIEIVKKCLHLDDIEYVIKQKGGEQNIYCFFVEVDEKDYDYIFKKITQEEKEEKKEHKHELIKSFMSIEPVEGEYHLNDEGNLYPLRHHENIEQIEKHEIPKHRLKTKNKFALADLVINHEISLNTKEINDCLLHDQLPYGNYNSLKDKLELYYDNDKKEVYEYEHDNQEDACLDVYESLVKNNSAPLLLNKDNGHIVYTRIPLEHKDMRTNKEFTAFELLNTRDANKEKHHCFHLFTNSSKKIKKLKIEEPIKITIEFNTENMADIKIDYKAKHIILENFYMPFGESFFIEKKLEKLWREGMLLTNFGKEYYKNEHKILIDTIHVPEWFNSKDNIDFAKLTKILNE